LAATLTDAGDWPAAEREFQHALQLAPSNALAHHWYATMLITLDRKQEALREIRRASELDPLSQPIRGTMILIEMYLGVRSPTAPRHSPIIDPNDPGAAAGRSVNLARGGRCSEAYAENKRAQQLAPDNNAMLNSLVGVRLLCGDRAGAMSLFAEVKRRPQIERQGVYIAEVHTKLGQVDSALAWLGRAHWGMSTSMELRIGLPLQPLRADSRYREILSKQNMR
jgi:Tfp pilus assembly protein PilF